MSSFVNPITPRVVGVFYQSPPIRPTAVPPAPSCAYAPPASMAPSVPGVFNFGDLENFSGGLVSSDDRPVDFLLSEDGKVVAVSSNMGSVWKFTRLAGDTPDFSSEDLNSGTKDSVTFWGMGRDNFPVGEVDDFIGG